MNWGRLNRGFLGVAIKRLSSHEFKKEVSKGHEFQGVNNFTHLLGSDDRDIRTTYFFVSDDGGEPRVRKTVECMSRWYDSRRRKLTRSAEWRLYYPQAVNYIQEFSKPGDLLLIALRNDGSLAIFLAPAGSVSEQVLMQAFGLNQDHYKQTGNVRWMRTTETQNLDFVAAQALEQLSFTLSTSEDSTGLSRSLEEVVAIEPEDVARGDADVTAVAAKMIERWPGDKLGQYVHVVDIVETVCDPDHSSEPDFALSRWLEVADASYRIWEKYSLGQFIAPLRVDPQVSNEQLVEKIGPKWMQYRQSRVSRAGLMMEEFVGRLLLREKLAFDRQAETEKSSLPDFLFPGRRAYHNPAFPADQLRILGSKTSLKDRWTQILAEGARVPAKHCITRDTLITPSMFAKMRNEQFTVVMPKSIMANYPKPPANLISFGAFIAEVKVLQGKP